MHQGGNATLFVKFRQVGYHCWPDAPNRRQYLRFRHRHTFHVRVELSAPLDGRRSVEFHDLAEHCRTVFRDVALRGTMSDYGTMSCEQIADAMARRISRVYGTVVGVSVSEDGECGAIVYADAPDD